MITKRNLLSMVLMMCVIFFLFQFSQVVKDNRNEFDVNSYTTNKVTGGEDRWKPSGDPDCLFIGDKGTEVYKTVREWCYYTKRNITAVSAAEVKKLSDISMIDIILIDGETVNINDNMSDILDSFAQEGKNIIFCRIPQYNTISNNEYIQELLGIRYVISPMCHVTAVQLYDGFLLGGEILYEENAGDSSKFMDLDLMIPWYSAEIGTKTYAVGDLDENTYGSEYFPRLMWRNTYKNGFVFCVCGDFMKDETGFGILDSFVYEGSDYYLYPVVNARNFVMTDFPYLAPENEEKIKEIYARNFQDTFRDIMWPDILAMAKNNNDLKMTCFFNTQLDYDDEVEPSDENLEYYLAQMKESGAEAGKSYSTIGGLGFGDKIEKDSSFWDNTSIGYHFAAAFFEKMPEGFKDELRSGKLGDLRTVCLMEDDDRKLLSFYDDRITVQKVTNDAWDYMYSKDLKAKSLITALGYQNVAVNMLNVVWPESGEDYWESYFPKVNSYLSSYWTRYDDFDYTTISESDYRVRNFLNLDYTDFRVEDEIHFAVTGNKKTDAWFILRTHGENVTGITGGDYRKLEEDAYLIHAKNSMGVITVESDDDHSRYSIRKAEG
ncbi:MAG: DUF2194 domain-containing protein [Lachnospiraceae bacterium]|nr:DUF2194 domain-containing protein [Lachnospiraceae bacterium]